MTEPQVAYGYLLCANDAHGQRRARFRVTFPGGQYRPTTACLACAHALVSEAALDALSIELEAVDAT